MCTLRCATGCNHVISGTYISTSQPFVNLHWLRERSHTVCWRFPTVYSNSTPVYLLIFIDWDHLFLISTHLQGIKRTYRRMICPASIPLVSCGEWFISMNWYEQDCEFHFFTNDSVNGVHIPFTDVQRSCFHPNLTYKLLFPTGQISQLPLHLLESRSLLALFVSSAMLPVDSLDNKTGRRHPPSTC